MAARAAPYLARTLRALDEGLAPAIPRVLEAADDEAIHDLRVAIRRIRTLLKAARPVYGRFHEGAVRGAFTAVHRATGALRDEEVLEETLGAIALPTLAPWLARRAVRERALRRAVVARLRAGDLTRARALLAALVTLPVNPRGDRDLARFARRVIEKARRGVEARKGVDPSDAAGLHALRITYKELRYAVEAFASVLPEDLAALAAPAAKLQKRLGEIHDVDMAIVTIRRARGLELATRAEALAALDAMRARKVAKYRAEMKHGADEELPAAP